MTGAVRITIGIFFSLLLICNTGFAATKRAAEELLSAPRQTMKRESALEEQDSQPEKSGATHKPLKKHNAPDSQAVQLENEKKAPVKSDPDKSRKADNVQQTVENGVQVKLQDCHYNPSAQSVTCTFQLTSQLDVSKVVLYCYSGTQAVDSNNKTLQCSEVQMGQNRSWEYILATLDKAPDTAEIHLQAASPVTSLSSLQMVMSVNGKRQTIQLANIAVH
jgi:hypothetical protein